jgi:hypothetical protein
LLYLPSPVDHAEKLASSGRFSSSPAHFNNEYPLGIVSSP